jgi:integrase
MKSTAAVRPAKPRPDFPLFPHANGKWAKKVRGKFRYFGKWTDDPKGARAIQKWLDEKEDLLAGREPRPVGDAGPTIKFLCDSYLTHKQSQRDNGEIKPLTFEELLKTCLRITAAFGRGRLVADLRPDDFRQLRKAIAKIRCAGSLTNELARIRSVFKYGAVDGIITTPVIFGAGFAPPSRNVVRLERDKKGRQDLQAHQVRAIIDRATIPLKAMVLLGINCAFGNNDCATLPIEAVDLAGGWVSYSRPKNGTPRRSKLWPETVHAIQAALQKRPTPKDKAHAKLVFLTCFGAAWLKGTTPGNDSLNTMFGRILRELGHHREGLGFYSLRRTFRTVADQLPDQRAINLVMGHTVPANDMAGVYVQAIGDDRLEAVAEHVRRWLFPAKKKPAK